MTDGKIDDEGGRSHRAASHEERLAYLDGWEMVRCGTSAKVPDPDHLAFWFRRWQLAASESKAD